MNGPDNGEVILYRLLCGFVSCSWKSISCSSSLKQCAAIFNDDVVVDLIDYIDNCANFALV